MAMTIPIDNRIATPTLGGRVVSWVRLFAIEMRRTPALYAGLLIAAVTARGMWAALPTGVVRWGEVSSSAAQEMFAVSAIAAGIGAYVAGRDQRLELDEQLSQTAFGRGRRDLLGLLAALVWCLMAYLVPVGGFFAYAATRATWSGPQWGYAAITGVTIVLGVAGGWLVGAVWPNRFSVIVAVGASLAVHGFYPLSHRLRTQRIAEPDGSFSFVATDAWYKNLFPYEVLDYYDVPSVIGWGAAWMLGLATLFACLAWWWRHRSLVAVVGFSVAAIVTGPAAAALVHQEPVNWMERSEASYVDPTCEARLDGRIEVCVHPQNEALLEDVAIVVERLVGPVAGIPGAPGRFAEQQHGELPPGFVWFYLHDSRSLEMFVTASVIREVLNDPSADLQYVTGSAQYVVLAWLLQETGVSPDEAIIDGYLPPVRYAWQVDEAMRAGITDPNVFADLMSAESETALPGGFEADLLAAIDRLASLPEAERRAWLERNWDALRANELTLEDLP